MKAIVLPLTSVPDTAEKITIQQIENIVYEVGNLKKIPVDNKELKHIWNISAEDIQQKKEICYMNPCVAQSLLTIHKLKAQKNIYINPEDITLGIEFLSYPDGRPSFHFFVTVKQQDKNIIIDFSHDNKVFLYTGTYKNQNTKHHITSKQILTFPATDIQATDTIFDIAEKAGMNIETLKKQLSSQIQKLQDDNTPEQRAAFDATNNTPLEIIHLTNDEHSTTVKNTQKHIKSCLKN
jgi:hypothetical protein